MPQGYGHSQAYGCTVHDLRETHPVQMSAQEMDVQRWGACMQTQKEQMSERKREGEVSALRRAEKDGEAFAPVWKAEEKNTEH